MPLSPEQLATMVPGTYGSILDTQRHLVGGDASYLFVIGGGRTPLIEEEGLGLEDLRAEMEAHEAAWSQILADDIDPDSIIVRHREDADSHAPLGIRLAQALHHGSDHRSQICTALTTIGIEPPEIDVWAFGWDLGRVKETPPTS